MMLKMVKGNAKEARRKTGRPPKPIPWQEPVQKDRHQPRTGTALETFLHTTHWLPQKSLNPAQHSTNREQMAFLAIRMFNGNVHKYLRGDDDAKIYV
ncbi:hypothetical protein ALC62_10408 [Cyphomyrmex costatus]|uniref:Uncharacterized protein n=1 Tax=Cyphomyrmex costatus TaxID=456900 RepID=A0A151IDV4_9HYME|nr:hypothetical protein ALC62_10408 [Cyphomyrmex costatus]